LHLKFKTKKKRIPFKLKPTPLKNWKNKYKVHLNLKKSILKTSQMDFEMKNEWRKELPSISSKKFISDLNLWKNFIEFKNSF
jgi:hypothetical protein